MDENQNGRGGGGIRELSLQQTVLQEVSVKLTPECQSDFFWLLGRYCADVNRRLLEF